MGLLVFSLWGSNRLEDAAPEQREPVRQQINRIDVISQWGALVGFGIAALLAWFV